MRSIKINVLDVGQGSSVVLDFGEHRYGIVDCGGPSGASSPLAGFLMKALSENRSMRILFVLLTHLDVDHVRSIESLVSNSALEPRIERLFCNEFAYRRLLQSLKKHIKLGMGLGANSTASTALRSLSALGDLIERRRQTTDFHFECVAPEASDTSRYPVRLRLPALDDEIVISIWAPSQHLRDMALAGVNQKTDTLFRAIFAGRELDDWNAASVVLTIDVAGRRVLLTGDATYLTWRDILNRVGDLQLGSDVTVAWHHGARLGTVDGVNYDALIWSRVLTRAVKAVCVSCGSRNNYSHPHKDTVNTVRSYGGDVYCTQRARSPVRPLINDDVTAMLLRSMAKKGLWIEEDASKCCGDIVCSIGSNGEFAMTCSSGDCLERREHGDCCLAEPPLITVQ